MGLSWPLRFLRSALGPVLRDIYPPENPETDIGAAQFMTAFGAVAGMNRTAARAVLVARWNGSTFQYLYQGEAWNAEESQVHPQLNYVGVGVYTYVFPGNVLDELGVSAPLVLTGARCSSEVNHANGRIRAYAWPTGSTVDIKLEDSGGTARDAAFFLEVF